MSDADLTSAERAKFELLERGVSVTERAALYLSECNDGRPLTPADYASTSGLILALPDNVWVNAPTSRWNPNFVDDPDNFLDLTGDGLVLRTPSKVFPVGVWLPPEYHGENNAKGEAYNSMAFTHADRVRISPVEGCSMTCKFCDLPYEFKYRTKDLDSLVESIGVAKRDPRQPAHHVLVSGGTPRNLDIPYVRAVYESVVGAYPDLPVDVMMVPVADLMDPIWLHEIGVNELSINVEIFDRNIASYLMKRKSMQGLETYLNYLEKAASVFGPNKVRSMLMVGLEPIESTLAGVRAIAERGAVPVLSPFRPDDATPLRSWKPPSADEMMSAYLASLELVRELGGTLGPSCIPCSHNTLTLASGLPAGLAMAHSEPRTV